MANNIKYIRWAAKLLKIITIISIFTGFGNMYIAVGGAAFVGIKAGSASTGMAAGGLVIAVNFVGILFNAFCIYTAARTLELLADVAYHLLMTWHRSQGIPTPPNLKTS